MEFTDKELDTLEAALDSCPYFEDDEEALLKRIHEELEKRQELVNIDFNECEGGACKL